MESRKSQRIYRKQLNWRVLFRVQGFLLIVLAGFMLLPMGVSIYHRGPDTMAFAVSAAVSAVTGASTMWLCRGQRGAAMGKREGFLLTATVWIVLSVFGMLPFMIGKPSLGLSDAFFESMSGFTTTGASTIGDFSSFTSAMHLWRCMMQWIGGMGIIIFTVALLPMLNSSGGLQMFNAESTGFTHDKIAPRVSQTAKRLWLLYITLTALAAILLWIGPMSAFESVCHAMSTMSTGGFSTTPDGIGSWNSRYVDVVVMSFMFLGGVNFVVLYKLAHGHLRQAWSNESLRAYTMAIVGAALLLAAMGIVSDACGDWIDYVIYSLFNSVSALSSTGYDVGYIGEWGAGVLPVLLLLMLVGGCAGSTSGGMKVDRMAYMWKNLRNELKRSVYPNRYYPLSLNGRVAGADVLNKVSAFIALYLGLIFVGGMVLTLTGMNAGDAFVASLACIGNTASSTESVASAFVEMTDCAKWMLSFLMMAGRLELFTVMVLLIPTFWRRG